METSPCPVVLSPICGKFQWEILWNSGLQCIFHVFFAGGCFHELVGMENSMYLHLNSLAVLEMLMKSPCVFLLLVASYLHWPRFRLFERFASMCFFCGSILVWHKSSLSHGLFGCSHSYLPFPLMCSPHFYQFPHAFYTCVPCLFHDLSTCSNCKYIQHTFILPYIPYVSTNIIHHSMC